MWLRRLCVVVALAAGVAAGVPCAAQNTDDPAAQRPSSGPITTASRQNAFTIPFRIEAAQSPAQEPAEVQLHVSSNGGRTWDLANRQQPAAGSFVFRAPHDGEYWFAIRTLDRQGVTRPEKLEAQLKVLVDTVAPRLDLTAARGAAGEIVARWQAVDPNLRAPSFKLEYQASAGGPWERVAVDSAPSAMRYTLSGQATWWPPKGSGSLTVRAEIVDAAGNPASSQALVRIGDSGGAAPKQPAVNGSPTPVELGPSNPTAWPADRATAEPLAREADQRPSASDTNGSAAETKWRASGGPTLAAEPRVQAQPVSQEQPANQQQPGRAASALDLSILPAGEKARMVPSRTFELEYEIDSVGPSGIAKVELWGTVTGGRTWTLFATDTDNRSPIAVQVETEGLYGFRIAVQSGNGLGGQPPVDGELPEIWVGVDLNKPTGRIVAVDLSADGTELAIEWEAHDEAPQVRPINLLYSTSPSGPWTPIASGLENVGSYKWRLESRVPPRIYIRLEVRDEATNTSTFDWSEPVSLDRSRPEGHIRGVRTK
jgi:hypothetical protein